MPREPDDLTDDELAFLAERHLGTLTTMRADGSPHVVAIAFSFDPADGLVRIITFDGSQKVRNVERTARAAEQIVVNTKDLVDQAKQGKLVFAQ